LYVAWPSCLSRSAWYSSGAGSSKAGATLGSQATASEPKKEKAGGTDEPVPAETGLRTALADSGAIEARDPFAPQVDTSPVQTTPVPEPVKSNASEVSAVSRIKLPPVQISGIKPLESLGMFAAPHQAELKTAEDELVLTGVIEGTRNVAVIRVGDKARFFVREGQSIDGKYTVESISRTGVSLRSSTGKFVLQLGGSQVGAHS
jgi:hypothetical protein